MGKIVMPKNSALLNEIEAVLKIYYEADDWLPNDIYKQRLKAMIGDDQYSSSYTKKAQITSYFGFTVWEDITNAQSRRKITSAGKRMYEAIKANDREKIQAILLNSLETVKFGRENFGCPESNSDVEPPALFVRASIDLGYLTYKEFAYLLWKLEDIGANYTDSIAEVRAQRSRGIIDIGEEATKYTDCKPIMILVRWGFLSEDDSEPGSRKIRVAPEVIERYGKRLRNLKIYNIDMNCESVDEDDAVGDRVTGGENRIYYGVPGSGKSFAVDGEIEGYGTVERVVFHPDYTYSDFIGQILPTVVKDEEHPEGKLRYVFSPGPFTKSLDNAENNPNQMHYLVIEEINRGNAPAIFGDVFQLLDRLKGGESRYFITNYDIAQIVYGDETHQVKIPSNLSILATMNTSDQNVFTLDTAFQRRWQMSYIHNEIDKAKHAKDKIGGSGISWGQFASVINDEILEYNADLTSAEDKQLGAYFITKDELAYDKFPEKALKYLWDDAFKLERDKVFNPDIKSIGDLVTAYTGEIKKNNDPIKRVMRAEVYRKMMDKSVGSPEEAVDETEIFETLRENEE